MVVSSIFSPAEKLKGTRSGGLAERPEIPRLARRGSPIGTAPSHSGDYSKAIAIGPATLAISPRVLNQSEGLTLTPAGTAAVFVAALRSTAGNSFGRFIGFLLFDAFQRYRRAFQPSPRKLRYPIFPTRMRMIALSWPSGRERSGSLRGAGRICLKRPAQAYYRKPPRTFMPVFSQSCQADGLTLAPAGAAALLVTLLRSTAGSCFGRFIAWSSKQGCEICLAGGSLRNHRLRRPSSPPPDGATVCST